MVNRVRGASDAAGCRSGGTSIRRPYRSAVAIDGDAVRSAPWPLLYRQLRPIANRSVRIRAGVDRPYLVGLRRSAALLRHEHDACDEDRSRPGNPALRARHLHSAIAFACIDSGVISTSSTRPMYGSVMFASFAFVPALVVTPVTFAPRPLNDATAALASETTSP